MEQFWKLDSPKMCRDFLKRVRVGPEGNKIEYLQQADGKRISINEATDEQVLQVANEFANAMKEKKENPMFETHKLNENGFEQVKKFKTALSVSISKAMSGLPEGRDKAIFKTKIEEAVFFGTRAIASEPKNHTEIVNYPEAE